VNSDTVRVVRPDRHISVHTARNRRFGRAMPKEPKDKIINGDNIEGAVYRYDAMAAGQTFEAMVIFEYDEDRAVLFPLLTGEAALGGSRTGGYGRVSFHDAKVAGGDWREVGGSLIPHPDGRVIVTLLSDALTRDQYGQFVVDPEAVRAELAIRLKCTLEPKPAFLHGRAVGGFNRKWGLPLPQALAIEMGSVFVFSAVHFPQDRMRELESRGIGERLAEGFGRIAVNWHGEEPKLQVDTTPDSLSIATKAIPAGTASEAVARRMVDRMLGQQLDAALTKRASTLSRSIRRPRPSQLSRLQAVIQDALEQPPDEGRQSLTAYLGSIQERQITRRQFTGEPIGGKKTLLEWLQSLVDDTTDIWDDLRIRASDLPEVGGVKAALNPQLAYAYNLRLIHTVLVFAAKAKRKEERHAGTTLVSQDIA
jgi:CRISPR-associated protein Csx10